MTTPKLGFKAQLEPNQVSSEAMLCPLDWGRGLISAVTLLIIFWIPDPHAICTLCRS